MCNCKPTKRLVRTEKHCDHIKSVYSDGTWVINYLPRRK